MKIEPGMYKHYKGGLYEVIGIATHSESLEEMVLYRATSQEPGKQLWVRPLKMFTENVLVEGKSVPRFNPL